MKNAMAEKLFCGFRNVKPAGGRRRSAVLPIAQLGKAALNLGRGYVAVTIVFDVMLDKHVAAAGLAGEKRIAVGKRRWNQWIVGGVNRQDGPGQLAGRGVEALQVIERSGIGGVATNAIVERIIVVASCVDVVPVVEGISPGALLQVLQNVGYENNDFGQVFILVNVPHAAER